MNPDTLAEGREQFESRVHAWLEANAPRKGDPGDFSAAYAVSASTPEEFHERERDAFAVTRAWQRKLFEAGFAGRSWAVVAKLLYSEHARLMADPATRVLGAAATVSDEDQAAPWIERLLFAPALRLGGGTDEIQRNVIGEQGLGLPREPKATTGDPSRAGR